jgi:starvation-inducible DNA-binding protein
MATTNLIGLETARAQELAKRSLATFQLFYINTRSFHWNIIENKFFELQRSLRNSILTRQLK